MVEASRTNSPGTPISLRAGLSICIAAFAFACAPVEPPTSDPRDRLVERGRDIFFNETFAGNGRTCGTCHREEDNFGLSPAFIATLPFDDPLFVAETNPDLGVGFENPALMRPFGLIVENLDGFADLEKVFTMRGVPHVLSLSTSVESQDGPRTGWSGDGAPGDGSLRSFSTGAVIQHFPLTTNRVPGVDFRLPTDEELDALEAFMLSLGRQEDLDLPLSLSGLDAARGQGVFLDPTRGKCFGCHDNAGANASPLVFGQGAGNLNFNTGVELLEDTPPKNSGERIPFDDGFGAPGDGTFNTPPVVEAADTEPFFHNNSVETLEEAVAFYNTDQFNNSPAGMLLRGATGSGIDMTDQEVAQVSAFLRVINALENIRQTEAYLEDARAWRGFERGDRGLRLASEEIGDAIRVLRAASLHPDAVSHLEESDERVADAARRTYGRDYPIDRALAALERARAAMVAEES